MITLPNFVQTVTRQYFFPTVVDNFYTGNELYMRLREHSRPWTGGRQLVKSTVVAGRTAGGSYSGFDTFTTTQEDTRKQLIVDPCEYYWSVTLNGIQLAVNKGPEAFVDLMTAEFEDVIRAMEDKMGTDLYGDGTGNSSKAILGLNYHIDDATDVITYEGLSRSTYTTLKSTRNADAGALVFANLASDFNADQIGRDSPTLGLTTPAVGSIIEALFTLTYNVSVNQAYPRLAPSGIPGQGVSLSTGVNSLYFKGVPILYDEKCTSGNFWFLNEKHLWLYVLDYPSVVVEGTKDGFAWTGWKKSQNQNAIVGQILFAGQLFGDSPRTMSRRTTITS